MGKIETGLRGLLLVFENRLPGSLALRIQGSEDLLFGDAVMVGYGTEIAKLSLERLLHNTANLVESASDASSIVHCHTEVSRLTSQAKDATSGRKLNSDVGI